jgi:hypothetical protein
VRQGNRDGQGEEEEEEKTFENVGEIGRHGSSPFVFEV